MDSLHCRLAVIILLAYGNSVDKVSADMRPAGAAPDPRQMVITLIAVSFQISAVSVQKLLCMAAVPSRGIAIQDDLRKTILTTSESHMNDWVWALRPSSFNTWPRVSSASAKLRFSSSRWE